MRSKVVRLLQWILSTLTVVFTYISKRFRLYFYALQFPGPFAWPFIGNLYSFRKGYQKFYKKMLEILASQPPVFRFWLGMDLLIVISQPKDVEVLLNSCLEKGKFYYLGKEITAVGLLVEPVEKWKVHRKIITPTFNSKILNSYVNTFSQHSVKLSKDLEKYSGESLDLFKQLFRCSLDIAIETLGDLDPNLVTGKDEFIRNTIRMEEIMAIRAFNVWLLSDLIFYRCSLGKEMKRLGEENSDFIKRLISTKRNLQNRTNKVFLNHLFESKLSENVICEETQTMVTTASETTALTISMVLLVLSIRPDIMAKIKKELEVIFLTKDSNTTLEDIKKMVYLESVINETLRLFPTVPMIMREVKESVKLDSYTIPANSFVLIPMMYMNKRSDFWKNPSDFNPDRFLDDKELRHRCTFIPFSYGLRNCIGFQYGMMSMKVILSTLLRHFKFSAVERNSLDDIELLYSIVAKPKNGYRVKITKMQ